MIWVFLAVELWVWCGVARMEYGAYKRRKGNYA